MKSGVSGISWHSKKKLWQVRATVNGTRRHIGYTPDINRAINMLEDYTRPKNPAFVMMEETSETNKFDIHDLIMWVCAIGIIVTLFIIMIFE